ARPPPLLRGPEAGARGLLPDELGREPAGHLRRRRPPDPLRDLRPTARAPDRPRPRGRVPAVPNRPLRPHVRRANGAEGAHLAPPELLPRPLLVRHDHPRRPAARVPRLARRRGPPR